jgi:hypothetical protein
MQAALRDLAGYLEPFRARQLSAEVTVQGLVNRPGIG